MKFLAHLEGYLSSRVEIANKLLTLFKLEAKLAELNAFPFLIGIVLLIPLLLTLWLLIMVILGYLVFVMAAKLWVSFLVLLAIHVLMLWIIISDLKRRIRQMSFVRTRDCLAHESTKKSIATSHQ